MLAALLSGPIPGVRLRSCHSLKAQPNAVAMLMVTISQMMTGFSSNIELLSVVYSPHRTTIVHHHAGMFAISLRRLIHTPCIVLRSTDTSLRCRHIIWRRRRAVRLIAKEAKCKVRDAYAAKDQGHHEDLYTVSCGADAFEKPSPTIAFHEMGSMKLLKISANVCADTLARPTARASLFMQRSQLLHTDSRAGARVSLSHLLAFQLSVQASISVIMLRMASSDFLSTSARIVAQKL